MGQGSLYEVNYHLWMASAVMAVIPATGIFPPSGKCLYARAGNSLWPERVNYDKNCRRFYFPDGVGILGSCRGNPGFQIAANFGVNTITTESLTYRDDLIDLAHALDMRFVGGISCFSEHGGSNQLLHKRPELWPILETGEKRPLMEWYIGVTPTFDDYNQSRLDEIERIMRDHALDGMCLDFVRWPLHWELELRPGAPEPFQSSFDLHTLARFSDYAGT